MRRFCLPVRVRLLLTTPEPARMLQELMQQGLVLRGGSVEGDFELSLTVTEKELPAIEALAEKRGCTLNLLERSGIGWRLRKLFRRRVLLVGLTVMVLLSLWVPSRVFFVAVEGNEAVPAQLILEQAESFGLCFGCSRRSIRSEPLKNQLLEAIPSLQWAGVNTRGCVATVTVREREKSPDLPEQAGVSHIIALRDAVILRCQASRGKLLVLPGQAVRQGEILISGLTDCGSVIRAQRAAGEVFGQTARSFSLKIPEKILIKGPILESKTRYALCIGKKRINFFKESGNLPSGCDKIVSYYGVTLPGGFALPVQLVKEQLQFFEAGTQALPASAADRLLREEMKRQMNSQMIAGRLLHEDGALRRNHGCFTLEGTGTCTELIGREQTEEFFK